ncbi:hypothetical protein SAMN05216228_102151 [Rhizobium tibeticum]|uniref:Uncharacterized protein n=1 Tax=Rhizobium tibeticum TaxID=501024 RepID=A0ABY1ARD0_9HYPH|nr:hypothetical protein SAMN05216228_102151 [Rhizobium tibeticum]
MFQVPWPSAGTSMPFGKRISGMAASCMMVVPFSIKVGRPGNLSTNPVTMTMITWNDEFRSVMLT